MRPTPPKEVRKDCWIVGFVGAAMGALGGTLPISMGEKTIPSDEAWALGLAPTFVAFGLALVGLAYAMYRGFGWVRWPITLWFPAYFCTLAAVSASKDIAATEYDWLGGLIVTGIWLYGTWTIFRGKEMKAHLS